MPVIKQVRNFSEPHDLKRTRGNPRPQPHQGAALRLFEPAATGNYGHLWRMPPLARRCQGALKQLTVAVPSVVVLVEPSNRECFRFDPPNAQILVDTKEAVTSSIDGREMARSRLHGDVFQLVDPVGVPLIDDDD